jgi:hypothetical protein
VGRPITRLVCGILLLCGAHPVAAAPLPVPPLSPIEAGRYRASDVHTGVTLWQEDWTLRQQVEGGQTVLVLSESGRGVRDSTTPTAWTLTLRIARWGAEPHVTATRQVREPTGRLLRVEERDLDYAGGVGHLRRREGASEKTATRTIPLKASTIPVELLPAILRRLPEEPGQAMAFELITHEGSLVPMEAKIVGEEPVTVPAGTYQCYRVQLTPTGLTGFLAGLVLPKFLMWHAVAAPHFWVKYQGPAGGLGSPEIVRELLRFEAGG